MHSQSFSGMSKMKAMHIIFKSMPKFIMVLPPPIEKMDKSWHLFTTGPCKQQKQTWANTFTCETFEVSKAFALVKASIIWLLWLWISDKNWLHIQRRSSSCCGLSSIKFQIKTQQSQVYMIWKRKMAQQKPLSILLFNGLTGEEIVQQRLWRPSKL